MYVGIFDVSLQHGPTQVTPRKQTEIRKKIDLQNQVQVTLRILEARCMLFKYEASSKVSESLND